MTNEEEKIGFQSPAPGEKLPKKVKFESVNKRTPLRKWAIFFFVFSNIATTLMIMYFFAPAFAAILGILYVIILMVIIVVPIIFTLGLILTQESYRAWVGDAWDTVNWFFDISNHLADLQAHLPIFAWPTLLIDSIALLLASIGQGKEKKGYVTYIVMTAIWTTLILIFLIFYYANGNKIFVQ